MAGEKIAVKKYVVRLSAEEREQLASLIRFGKASAQVLTKARILLKADVSEAGEGWSDSRIAEALDASVATIERMRRQLVEEGAFNRLGHKALDAMWPTLRKWGARAKVETPPGDAVILGEDFSRPAAPRSDRRRRSASAFLIFISRGLARR